MKGLPVIFSCNRAEVDQPLSVVVPILWRLAQVIDGLLIAHDVRPLLWEMNEINGQITFRLHYPLDCEPEALQVNEKLAEALKWDQPPGDR